MKIFKVPQATTSLVTGDTRYGFEEELDINGVKEGIIRHGY